LQLLRRSPRQPRTWELVIRLGAGEFHELILATNPNTDGEATGAFGLRGLMASIRPTSLPSAATNRPDAVSNSRSRHRDHTHHQATRAAANRLVGILHGRLRHHTTYHEGTAWPATAKHPLGTAA
jgi:hypothetical protein